MHWIGLDWCDGGLGGVGTDRIGSGGGCINYNSVVHSLADNMRVSMKASPPPPNPICV